MKINNIAVFKKLEKNNPLSKCPSKSKYGAHYEQSAYRSPYAFNILYGNTSGKND